MNPLSPQVLQHYAHTNEDSHEYDIAKIMEGIEIPPDLQMLILEEERKEQIDLEEIIKFHNES